MKKSVGILLGVFFAISVFTVGIASSMNETYVVSNSENWKDVYSTLEYANMRGIGSSFLTSTEHGKILLKDMKRDNRVLVVSSRQNPYVINYASELKDRGFEDAEERIVSDANTEIIDNLPDIQNFIVVDDSYGYNAIAVIPYANLKNAWVFLSSKANIEKIDSVLQNRNVKELLVYGYVDREVRNTLEKYNPRYINSGDKFDDNIEIVKEYEKIKQSQQVLLTNGEFIEGELMAGKNPILFTGKENVPDKIRDYIKSSPIKIGVLIGNDLVGAATNIRRSTGISVMVKFARGSRQQTGGVSAVEGLDLFPIPSPSLTLIIDSIKYNTISKQLEIVYKSESNTPLYFKGTIDITSGTDTTKLGDEETIFLAPGGYKTIKYDLKNIGDLENIKAKIYTLYGETKASLDRILTETLDVSTISVLDNCKLEINKITYNKQKNQFIIFVKNKGKTECWAIGELKDIFINFEETTIGSKTPSKIKKGKSGRITISQKMFAEDLENNPIVDVRAWYGERQENLVNVQSKSLPLNTSSLTLQTYLIIIISIIVVVLFIIWFLRRRRKKEEDDFF